MNYLSTLFNYSSATNNMNTLQSDSEAAKRILIVDDETDICLLLAGLLRKLGYMPTYVHMLEEGRQYLKNQQFDAIFLDLNLPDGLGFDLLSAIRQADTETKVIMISAFDGQTERLTAQKYGADFFVGKPFTRKAVEQALESVLH